MGKLHRYLKWWECDILYVDWYLVHWVHFTCAWGTMCPLDPLIPEWLLQLSLEVIPIGGTLLPEQRKLQLLALCTEKAFQGDLSYRQHYCVFWRITRWTRGSAVAEPGRDKFNSLCSVNELPGGNEFTQSWTNLWLLSDPLSLSKFISLEWWLNNERLPINSTSFNLAAATRWRWSSDNSWSAIYSICISSSFFLMEILCFCLARRRTACSCFSAYWRFSFAMRKSCLRRLDIDDVVWREFILGCPWGLTPSNTVSQSATESI